MSPKRELCWLQIKQTPENLWSLLGELNMWESQKEINFIEKNIFKAENGFVIPVGDFCKYIKECEANTDMTE